MAAKKVGVLTGGGDCPGLNAVIRAVVRRAARGQHETPKTMDLDQFAKAEAFFG